MKVAFGYDIKSLDDPFIKVSEETSKISGWAMTPGRWLVDYIPSLRHIPCWFPGTAWKRQGLVWRERLTHLSDVPHQWVKEQMNMGRGTESFTARLLSQLAEEEQDVVKAAETEDIIKWCAGALYAGAAHTTVSALTSFMLLMALHPDIQQKARDEVDQLFKYVGAFDTVCLSKLRYLRATMKEVLRYAPVANLALSHCVTQEDEYLGYRIPKGATILPNVWAIMHDPTLYPDPFTFSPERFMPLDGDADATSVQPDPAQFAFGFGRRACPGTEFAEASLLLIMANTLHRFVLECKDGLTPSAHNIEFTTGITR
ncbi:cytochrome P450 [Panaeolus papilionaceus]|nr:cytochrome P450 [Panaeolus papilionaceus]